MKFTLYIDESGDFETERGQWVLSGVLFSASYDKCELQLNNKLSVLPNELTKSKDLFGVEGSSKIRTMKDFHLTDFRREFGHDIAVKIASKTINKLSELPFEFYCLVAINHSRFSLSDKEKTYRVMLSDLLALCETIINEDDNISRLDLVVASRTIEGELQTSTSNIKQEIIHALPVALEVDLATKGMVDLIGKHIKVRMDYANNSWGLICADFLANLNYHYKKKDEKALLSELEERGKYSLFESFGGYEIRRANISERDGDYILSMVRWINIYNNELETKKAKEAIQRLFIKIFNRRGTTGSSIAFEAILDRLWRQNNQVQKYYNLISMLKLFEAELTEHIIDSNYSEGDIYLFRLRNLMLLTNNHLGKTADGLKIAELQNSFIPTLSTNPENFQTILNFKINEIETHINALDFKKALKLSSDYAHLILNYRETWQLLLDEREIIAFDNSRASIKSIMTSFRCNILNVGFNEHCIDKKIENDFTGLSPRLNKSFDKSRYHNYKIMYLLKLLRPKHAVDYAIEQYNGIKNNSFNSFDLFWLIKAVNNALLSDIEIDPNAIRKIINVQLRYVDINEKGHPTDLVLRELALFEKQMSNKSLALKYIKKSRKMFNVENSEIGQWLKDLIDVHEDFIAGKMKNERSYFDSLADISFVNYMFASNIDLTFFEKVRYFSPY